MCAHSCFVMGTRLPSRSCSVLENGMMTKHLKTCCVASTGMERNVTESVRHCYAKCSNSHRRRTVRSVSTASDQIEPLNHADPLNEQRAVPHNVLRLAGSTLVTP